MKKTTLTSSLLNSKTKQMSDPVKAGIFNRSLPESLQFINVFQYKNDWKQLCNYVKDVILCYGSRNSKKKLYNIKTQKIILFFHNNFNFYFIFIIIFIYLFYFCLFILFLFIYFISILFIFIISIFIFLFSLP